MKHEYHEGPEAGKDFERLALKDSKARFRSTEKCNIAHSAQGPLLGAALFVR
jgi:hypothetical protein